MNLPRPTTEHRPGWGPVVRPWHRERTPLFTRLAEPFVSAASRPADGESRVRAHGVSPMSSILVINAAGRETRVALVENGHIAEFYLERKKDKGVVGNIYKGRVVRVLPGMQAAFVDIGLDKAAFLYVSDVVYDPDFARAPVRADRRRARRDAPRSPS